MKIDNITVIIRADVIPSKNQLLLVRHKTIHSKIKHWLRHPIIAIKNRTKWIKLKNLPKPILLGPCRVLFNGIDIGFTKANAKLIYKE